MSLSVSVSFLVSLHLHLHIHLGQGTAARTASTWAMMPMLRMFSMRASWWAWSDEYARALLMAGDAEDSLPGSSSSNPP